jgi:hypothetical protein
MAQQPKVGLVLLLIEGFEITLGNVKIVESFWTSDRPVTPTRST